MSLFRLGISRLRLLTQGFGNHFGEPVQNRLVVLGETAQTRRENLQQADHPDIGHDGNGYERAYAQSATDFRINARVVFHIAALDEEASANTFSGETLLYVHRGSERRRWFTGSRPADHLVIREKRQSRATGSGEAQGGLGDQLQNCIDVLFTNLADLAANCFQRREHSAWIGHWNNTQGIQCPAPAICECSDT